MKYMGIKKSRTTPYHPQCNGIVERWHRSMKSALTARLIDNKSWCDELPTVLLGLRAACRSDNGVSSAEYVYGKTLRLPGDFYNIPDNPSISDDVLLSKLKNTISNLKPVSHDMRDSRTLFVHDDLNKCKHVFIRNDAIRKPLTPIYEGPYPVLERNTKTFILQLPNRKLNISIDRLKPAYLINEQNENNFSKAKFEHRHDSAPNKHSSIIPSTDSLLRNTSDKNINIKKTRSGRIVKPRVTFNL
ncbi:hypothetical protein K1T71_000786 [Dendrolimus kikuchii]|uniref:Uncharacterized protein n=1 Tax=Dendrolimus kikuchii TaxID=765133 RepID=A0ACC1DKR7_9NEOP|nr:hypothetical protein K1T71_000786 [Dendrolimus kikuchii]